LAIFKTICTLRAILALYGLILQHMDNFGKPNLVLFEAIWPTFALCH